MIDPISFECRVIVPQSGEEICAMIADVTRWPDFRGYGPLPGIGFATYERRTEAMVGSRIRVRNTDGSGHVEEITRWVPGKLVELTFRDFAPPLSYLATHFVETWHIADHGAQSEVVRWVEMYPTRASAQPMLWLVSSLLRRAIARHLAQLSG